jgi:hypothetical protein
MRILFLLALGVFLVLPSHVHAQCATDVNLGQNLVVNGDFSSGYSNWAFDAPYKIKGGGNSNPTDLQVGTNPATFNTGGGGFPPFDTYGDHTTGSGNFLMVDGYCSASSTVKVWSQTVNVVANTNYFFSVWISSLKDMPTNPGNLNFNIAGADLGSNILAPTFGGATASNGTNTGGGWIRYVIVWNSGVTTGPVLLSIQNNNLTACGSEVDFGLDDIAFTPGCDFGAPGPQPNLGPDRSLCGTGGSITLDANVPHTAATTVSWSSNSPGVLTGTGLGAPYTKTFTAPGTYSVCVTAGGSCLKSDVIVITNTFSVNIGGPYSFCSNTSQTLDAVFTGTGVTYQWFKNGTLVPYPNDTRTYTATSAGTYRVDVAVAGCATQSSTTTITTSAPVTPIDAYYCATSGPVSGVNLQATNSNSANLSWFTAATGGSPIAAGVTSPNGTTSQYALPTIPMGTTATQTYYVQDNTAASGTVGPTAEFATGSAGDIYPGNAITTNSQNGIFFSLTQDFDLNSVQIPIRVSNGPGGGGPAMSVTSITLRVYTAAGAGTAVTATSTNAAVTIAGGGNNVAAYSLYTFSFTGFTIPISLGSNLILKMESIVTNYPDWRYQIGNRTGLTNPFPYTSTITPNPVSITSSLSNNSNTTTQYFGLYNWNISAKTPCARTPVRAISNCVTPVTWTSFFLIPQDNSCKITWSTADESNNDYFAIERSVDGINFEVIGTTQGGGNRVDAANYYFIDYAPLAGTAYYRITQYDYDGKSSSTVIKPYTLESSIEISTYPNPFQNSTTLLVSGSDTNEEFTYTIYTVSGQLVETGTGIVNQTQSVGNNLAKGMYLVSVTASTDKVTTKIVKQ